MAITTTDTGLLRLLQLSSATLPVGAYAFSQGLEYAVDQGWLTGTAEVSEWLTLQLQQGFARVDCPLLLRCYSALADGDSEKLRYWNQYALACRESKELLLTDTATGSALMRLSAQLGVPDPFAETGPTPAGVSFVTAFALAAHHWRIDAQAAAFGLVWSWLENQVAAATKLVPLGQTQAQQLLAEIQQRIPATINRAGRLEDNELGSGLPALAIASARHEHQYSRLFRS